MLLHMLQLAPAHQYLSSGKSRLVAVHTQVEHCSSCCNMAAKFGSLSEAHNMVAQERVQLASFLEPSLYRDMVGNPSCVFYGL